MQSKVPLNHSALPKNMHLSPQNILWSVTLNITGYLFSCASFPFQIYSVGTNLSMTIICRKKKKNPRNQNALHSLELQCRQSAVLRCDQTSAVCGAAAKVSLLAGVNPDTDVRRAELG